MYSTFKRLAALVASCMSIVMLTLASDSVVVFAQAGHTDRMTQFNAASKEFGVPTSVLLALSYNESRWQSNTGLSNDGGYGLMDLRTYIPTITSGRDGRTMPAPRQSADYYTLDEAASMLHVPKVDLQTNDAQNIRGAAAVLAADAKQLNGGTLPTNINDWFGAVAEFSGATNTSGASTFAHDVFITIKTGAGLTTSDGQTMNLPASPSVRPTTNIPMLNLQTTSLNNNIVIGGQTPECPSTLNCRFIPAAYAEDDPTDPTNYGNYDPANRPKDMKIHYIFIHDGEGSYDSIINHFQDPKAYDSAQYVISSKGDITQMVTNEGVSWGVANWNMNMHGINIEHEGFAAQGATWFTPEMYRSSATLVRWLANKYDIPLDRQHILGHDNIMYRIAGGQATQHWDPGPFWDWNYYMGLLKGGSDTATPSFAPLGQNDVITISPTFTTNQLVVADCQTGTCVTLPQQGANFVYLHTQPSNSAPLLSDPYLHTDNAAGSTRDDDWGDKAPAGAKYVVAATQNDWVGIWYSGRIGWFHNPQGTGKTAHRSSSLTITPRDGVSSIPVYTSATPEASAFPADVPPQSEQTAYSMPAGQRYTTLAPTVASDYYYDATVNYSLPDDHIIVAGNQKYYEISFNHHIGFVKVEDVVLQ